MSSKMLELELTSDPKELPDLRSHVRSWLEECGWPQRQIGEVVLALDEAVTNVIRHGYDNEPGNRIVVTAEVVEDPVEGPGIEIRVRDFGRQVDPCEICGRDLDDVRPGGLGVHIIRAMNNFVEYEQATGGGMLLTMRKYRTHTAVCDQPPAERK